MMNKTMNPWPLGIIMAFAAFISGTALMVVLACSQRSDLVRSDYYDQEIRHQEQMNRVSRTQHSAPDARVHFDAAQHAVEISLPLDQAVLTPEGRVHFYRPSSADLDQIHPLVLDAQGRQRLEAHTLLPGLWRVQVSWTIHGEEYHLDQRLVITPKS